MTSIFTADQRPRGDFAACDPPNLLDLLVAKAAASDSVPRIIIDGPSGSGKSTIGKYLARSLGAQLVQMDHIYTSWNGLAAAGQRIVTELLQPLSANLPAKIQHWDWEADDFGVWQELAADVPLVIEGSASLNRASVAYATLKLWVEVPDELQRKQRALKERPHGDIYAPYWESWGAQERAHIAQENPQQLADLWLQPGVFPGDPLYKLVRGTL